MPKIESRTRDDIAAFLPKAIRSALQSYQGFSEEQSTNPKQSDAKNFKDHHDACKVAIAHIELLIKLAQWADLPPPELDDENAQAKMQMLIECANTELKR